MTELLEAVMLAAFSAGWYFSIARMLRTGQAAGKSVGFVVIVAFGYVCGIGAKGLAWRATGSPEWIILLYTWNLLIVALDLYLVVTLSRRVRPGALTGVAGAISRPR